MGFARRPARRKTADYEVTFLRLILLFTTLLLKTLIQKMTIDRRNKDKIKTKKSKYAILSSVVIRR